MECFRSSLFDKWREDVWNTEALGSESGGKLGNLSACQNWSLIQKPTFPSLGTRPGLVPRLHIPL